MSPVKSESNWVVHASRVLPPFRLGLSASRRNNLFKVREDETSSPARATRSSQRAQRAIAQISHGIRRRFTSPHERDTVYFRSMIVSDKITYLDNNATTAIDQAVLEAMRPFLDKYFANPSSGYRFAAQVRDAIEQARERVAALLGCEPGEIVFTSCGTESNNTAFHSALEARRECKHVVTTAVEHSAVRKPAQELERQGYKVTVIGVDKSGRLSLRAVADAIRPDTALVSVMWANNETGVIFPIEEIAQIARDKNVPLHTDAVQAAGKIPIKLREVQLQFLSISGHKLHAPKGVGALYVNRRSRFHPLLLGGSHENNRRAGTENAASIVALGKAAEVALTPPTQSRLRRRLTSICGWCQTRRRKLYVNNWKVTCAISGTSSPTNFQRLPNACSTQGYCK